MAYFAKSHKSAVAVRLNAKTELGAKREAWAWITEKYTGVTLLLGDAAFSAEPIAYKCVDPMTGKVEAWKSA